MAAMSLHHELLCFLKNFVKVEISKATRCFEEGDSVWLSSLTTHICCRHLQAIFCPKLMENR